MATLLCTEAVDRSARCQHPLKMVLSTVALMWIGALPWCPYQLCPGAPTSSVMVLYVREDCFQPHVLQCRCRTGASIPVVSGRNVEVTGN